MPLKGAISNYANAILSTYATPIALDRLEPIICMTVGAGRIKLLGDLYARVCNALACGGAGGVPAYGIRMEAVTGEFGAGKSHIGYMLKQNVLSAEEEVLLSHVQITGAARFQDSLASILRSLQISSQPSYSANGVEVGAYRQLFAWYGNSEQGLYQSARNMCGNISDSAARYIARAVMNIARDAGNSANLQQIFAKWVSDVEPRAALEMFMLFMRLFVGVRVCRLVLIIDEFEAIQHLHAAEQRAILQSFQDLHDSLAKREAGSLSAYLVFLSTEDWINKATALLPSFGSGNRLRGAIAIPDLCVTDIRALVYKSYYFHLMSDTSAALLTEEQIEDVCQSVIAASDGKRYHLRSIQRNINDAFGQLLRPAN